MPVSSQRVLRVFQNFHSFTCSLPRVVQKILRLLSHRFVFLFSAPTSTSTSISIGTVCLVASSSCFFFCTNFVGNLPASQEDGEQAKKGSVVIFVPVDVVPSPGEPNKDQSVIRYHKRLEAGNLPASQEDGEQAKKGSVVTFVPVDVVPSPGEPNKDQSVIRYHKVYLNENNISNF